MISVVIPVFNEEDNINPLYGELKEILAKLPENFEIIFTNFSEEYSAVKRAYGDKKAKRSGLHLINHIQLAKNLMMEKDNL